MLVLCGLQVKIKQPMDTQDSIDIVKLKRAALGQVSSAMIDLSTFAFAGCRTANATTFIVPLFAGVAVPVGLVTYSLSPAGPSVERKRPGSSGLFAGGPPGIASKSFARAECYEWHNYDPDKRKPAE